MNIAIWTTWNRSCGFSALSKILAEAYERRGHKVNIISVWSLNESGGRYDARYISCPVRIEEYIKKHKIDIVQQVITCSDWMFDPGFKELIKVIHKEGAKIVFDMWDFIEPTKLPTFDGYIFLTEFFKQKANVSQYQTVVPRWPINIPDEDIAEPSIGLISIHPFDPSFVQQLVTLGVPVFVKTGDEDNIGGVTFENKWYPNYEDLVRAYHKCSIMVCDFPAWPQATVSSSAVLTASMKRPMVVPNVKGTEGTEQFAIRTGDVSTALRKLLSDEGFYTSEKERVIKYIESWNVDRAVERYVKFFKEVRDEKD